MARGKKTATPDDEKGQMDLIPNVGSENGKEILKVARQYQALKTKRIAALEDEVSKKQELLELIHNAGLKPMDDGKIKFTCEKVVITVTPRDELIKVKEADDE